MTGVVFNHQVALATSGFTIVSQGSEVTGAGTVANPWIGNNTGGVTNDTGTVAVKYAGPVSSVTTQYRSREFFNGVQSIAFGDLGWRATEQARPSPERVISPRVSQSPG